MATQIDTAQREIVLVEDAHIRPMMGNQVLESLPSRNIPYSLVDPYILVHEAVVRIDPQQEQVDTTHPHRGFDNLWYAISGSLSTGHSTGPGGSFERARLDEGAVLKIRTGRGVLHAEGLGEDERREGKVSEMRGLLFWVNLARKDKNVEPTAQVVSPDEVPARQEGDATIRVLVGEGSTIELGTPGLILDVELPKGGKMSIPVRAGFNGFVYRALYDYFLPFRALRIPALAVILVGFSLAVLAGFGVERMSSRITSPSVRAALVSVLCVAVLVEACSIPVSLTSIPAAPPPIYTDLLRDIGDSSPATIVIGRVAALDLTSEPSAALLPLVRV